MMIQSACSVGHPTLCVGVRPKKMGSIFAVWSNEGSVTRRPHGVLGPETWISVTGTVEPVSKVEAGDGRFP